MVLAFLLSAFSGFLAKTADETNDYLGPLSGAAYGVALVVAISLDALLATVFLPAVAANLVAGKIDSKNHMLGLAVFLAGLVFFNPASPIRIEWAALAFAAALADELADLKLAYPRPFLPLTAILLSFLAASYVPILAVLLFDGGYLLAQRVWKKEETGSPTTRKTAAKTKKQKKTGRHITI